MDYRITLLPGDGAGAEAIDAAVAVLSAIEQKFGHNFHLHRMEIGGSAIDSTGVPLPKETLDDCKRSGAVLFGAIGGSKWEGLKPHMRPERGFASLVSGLGLFATLNPISLYDELIPLSPLRPDLIKKGLDILILNDTGAEKGEHGYRDGALGQEAFDTEVYSISEAERIAKLAFELAGSRGKRVTCVDNANAFESHKLFFATVERIAKTYPAVTLEHLPVDLYAARLVKNPSGFDVVLAPDLYGDLISDTTATLTGSVGMLPFGIIGGGNVGIYGARHGSIPEDIAPDEVNPIATILASAMMLSTSFKLFNEAMTIEAAVHKVIAKGFRTKDIAVGMKKPLSTSRMTEEIALAVLNM